MHIHSLNNIVFILILTLQNPEKVVYRIGWAHEFDSFGWRIGGS